MWNSGIDTKELVIYELGFLILPSIPEERLTEITDAIRKVIAKKDGTEIDAEEPFKQLLAYPMSKTIGASRYVLSDAYLGWIKFEIEPSKISTIKADIEKIKEILRFLLIKVPRETTFTFAKARAALAKKDEQPVSSLNEGIVVE
ncbi:MAG: 30S ribosomal protein S6 [Candidatus Zambryskibacteria bacterium]|nr:30S ribosomal protein S6 [Candidatus Zambryskibacteria bacterium]